MSCVHAIGVITNLGIFVKSRYYGGNILLLWLLPEITIFVEREKIEN